MNSLAVSRLGRNAREWARCYVELVEALLAEGVPEEYARREAQRATTLAALSPSEEEECPVCGTRR